MRNQPLISVIMPAHNAGAYIIDAIASVVAQTYPHWELWVIDDESTDETAEMVTAIRDERVRYYRVARQGKPSKVRNVGMRLAKGDYIAFLDADDLYFENTLERFVQGFENNPDAIAVYGFAAYMNEDGQPILDGLRLVTGEDGQTRLPSFYKHRWETVLMGQISCMLPGLMIPRSTLEAVGMFDEDLLAAEDYEFYSRLFLEAFDQVVCLPEYMYRYRVYPNSMTKQTKNAPEILTNSLSIMEGLLLHPGLPRSAMLWSSLSFTHCYRYHAREHILHGHPGVARQFVMRALLDGRVHFLDWQQLCFPLLVRSFIPAGVNRLLISARSWCRQQLEKKTESAQTRQNRQTLWRWYTQQRPV